MTAEGYLGQLSRGQVLEARELSIDLGQHGLQDLLSGGCGVGCGSRLCQHGGLCSHGGQRCSCQETADLADCKGAQLR